MLPFRSTWVHPRCFVDRCTFFCLAIVLSVLLRYTYSDYQFDIFKLFHLVIYLTTETLTILGMWYNCYLIFGSIYNLQKSVLQQRKTSIYISLCLFSARNCTREGQIKCAEGIQCIWETQVCDGYSSCLDESDEGDHCLGNTYALLIVYLVFYLISDMKFNCTSFILRRQW